MSLWDGRILQLWHGTTMPCALSIQANGPDLSRSRASLDFGAGFYLTTRQQKALEWAMIASGDRTELPAIMRWDIAYDDFASAPKLAFADAGRSANDFWEFVYLNRRVRQVHRALPLGNFGIVIGPASQWYQSRIAVADMDQVSFHSKLSLGLLNSVSPTIYGVRAHVTSRSHFSVDPTGGKDD